MSLMMFTGKRGNIIEETPQHCRQLKLPHPILTSEDIERLRTVKRKDFKVATISALFDAMKRTGRTSLKRALDNLVDEAEKAIHESSSLIIISDRGVSKTRAAIPSLLAASTVHQGLLNRRLRNQAGLIIESGEPREVTHYCLLCGFGANAVNPYLAFESLNEMQRRGEIPAKMEPTQIADNYIAAIKKGILKTMSKMGISTLRSYREAQQSRGNRVKQELYRRIFYPQSSRIGESALRRWQRRRLSVIKERSSRGRRQGVTWIWRRISIQA